MTASLVHGLLEAAAAEHGDRVAVVDGDRSVTYRELDAQANRLARLLVDLGVTRGSRVGLYLDKSLESVIGVYGVLKAAAAYVPLDANAPTARLGYIAGNCGITHLVTSATRAASLDALRAARAPVEHAVVLDAPATDVGPVAGVAVHGADEVAAGAGTPPAVPVISLDLAYILYTSGSTGDPKGVMLSHRNCLAFVLWAAETFAVGPEDRLSSHAPLHFDLSTFDLFAASARGASVVLVPAKASLFPIELARWIEAAAITVWYSVPSILTMLVLRGGLEPGALPRLRVVLFAGEVFPTKYLRALMDVLPHARFANLYGPTETNVCTWYEVPALDDAGDEPIPLGVAIDDVDLLVVTDDGRLAGPGEVGELLVRGPTVMQGYWADPERSGRSLVPPVGRDAARDLAYRTGDLVQERPDGNLRFLGRRDNQIKSRGYRIELGDVEAALYANEAVVECAVLAVPDEVVTNRLRAYVVADPGTTAVDLQRFCATRLPKYMVPDELVLRSALPKTSTGKVDRQALTRASTEDGER